MPVVDGYITLDNVTKDGHYNISKAVVESNTSTSEESDDIQHTGVYQDISPLSNRAVLIVILILIFLDSERNSSFFYLYIFYIYGPLFRSNC